MTDRPPNAETAPGVCFTFQVNPQPRPKFDATVGPGAVVTGCPPLSAVRHLLTGKPLRGAGRLPRPGRSAAEG